MILLSSKFWPILPDPGLLFWTTVIFFLFWTIIGKKAFGPIAEALKKREGSIEDALAQAEKARLEMQNLKAENAGLLAEAREEKTKIIREAKEMSKQMVAEAKEKASEEAKKMINNAKLEIENQRMAAMIDAKNKAGVFALEIAEKVIKKDLKGNAEHESFVKGLVEDIKLN